MSDDIHAHIQVRDWVSSHGLDGVGLLIAQLSHEIYKGHGLHGHVVRVGIRRNLWRYARDWNSRLTESRSPKVASSYHPRSIENILHQGWLKSLVVIFAAAWLGVIANSLTGSEIPIWLLLGFALIFSSERWLYRYLSHYRVSRWSYKLLLNLSILALFILLVWSATSLFSKHMGISPIVGVVIFVAEFVVFVWVWSVIRVRRRFRPSVKLTILSVAALFIVSAYAGVQPLTSYKDQAVQKTDVWLRSLKQSKAAPSAINQTPNLSKIPATRLSPTIATPTVSQTYETIFNNFRRQNGLQPLIFDPLLNSIAASRAVEISKDFSHAGINKYGNLGENIAMSTGGYLSDEEALRLWEDSPGHRANMLDPNYTRTGYANIKGYASQVFAW
jgi:uncharacterized protein YkwD